MKNLEEISEYQWVTEELISIPRFTEKHDFRTLRTYLRALDHPEQGYQVIHVAGTNGKGSVTRMLADLLRRAGLVTGAFYSPHLIRINERMEIDGVQITDEELVELYHELKAVQAREELPQLTFFENLFVLALMFFHRHGVDAVVLETGLGGRLDATTCIPADLHVITQIGLDHEEYLGHTIREVAGEKAGIITGPAPVIYHTGSLEADRVIEEKAGEMQVRTLVNAEEVKIGDVRIRFDGGTGGAEETAESGAFSSAMIDFSAGNDYYNYHHLLLSTGALYQVENAATVMEAARVFFSEKDPAELENLLRQTFLHFRWEGRLTELIPGVYADGAHNPSAAKELVKSVDGLLRRTDHSSLSEVPGGYSLRLVYGASSDKNIRGVLEELLRLPWEEIWILRYSGSRAASVEQVKEMAEELAPREREIKIRSYEDIDEAAELLRSEAEQLKKKKLKKKKEGRSPLTVITGSLYLVGEMKERLLQ